MGRYKMIIVAAPSGAGKSSFVARATQEMAVLRDTVTFTTRAIRNGESEGNPYHFVSDEKFEQLIAEGFFAEWAHVHNRKYGTPMYQLQEAWAEEKVIIMDVDVQGAATFKRKFPETCATVFILPPSLDELRRRVIKRDGGAPKDLDVRMQNALKEIAEADRFDFKVINDVFETSYAEFKKLLVKIIETP